ncbi:EutN/CcmL family microcompartment protein [Bacteroidota bacterium]
MIGHKLLIAQEIDLNGNYIGKNDTIALDLVDAGIGDTVLIVKEGAAVQQMLGHREAPVHTMVIAVIDDIEVDETK